MGSASPYSDFLGPPLLSTARTPPKAIKDLNVQHVVLGDLMFKTWYPSFYPEELVSRDLERLYVCQGCFKYSKELMPFLAHVRLCASTHATPPGKIIYTTDAYAIYEVDGEEHQLFAQNLSLFAKLFLDNKSVFFDVVSFKYYLLVHRPPPTKDLPQQSPRVVGFFSKEKMSWDNNNLACILIFPPWQRKGLGKILMGVSYELSKREGRIGGPEKPLSELGKKAYITFWEARISKAILHMRTKSKMTVREIAEACWILPEDVIAVLQEMDIVAPNKKANGSVVISKARVKEWVSTNHLDLTPPIDEKGFLEEWTSGEGQNGHL